jgi:hypothetical protein
MTVTNNFLPPQAFKDLQDYCSQNNFEIVEVGNKKFSVLETPRPLLDFFKIEGYELILTFIRSAKKDFDTDLRIHADNIINGHKTALASVLYINNEDEVSTNGTVFWKHHQHGHELEANTSEIEFNRLLTEDANDYSKWEQRDLFYALPNRRLLYNSNSFHSKWPAKIEKGERKVLVCFYAEKTKI